MAIHYICVGAAQRSIMGNRMLMVSEQFGPTIQGEGPSTGRRCVFLRLANCNLSCRWCFVPSTPILMGNHTIQRIDSIRVGDMVMSWNRDHFEPQRVTKVYKSIATDILRVDVPNRKVWCTPEHPFLTKHGWVKALDLKPGDSLVHWDVHHRMRMFNPAKKGVSNSTEEQRERASLRMAAMWKNPAFRRKKLKYIKTNNPMKNPATAQKGFMAREDRGKSKLESLIHKICSDLPIYYCGDGNTFSIAHRMPDFKVRGQNKVIEIWPADALWAKRANRDKKWMERRAGLFKKHGYETLFLPLVRNDLKASNRHLIHDKVARFISNGAIVKEVVKVQHADQRGWARLYGNAKTPRFVYNLEVEKSHTYVANTLVVHNCDTPYTWNWTGTDFKHPEKFDREKELHKMSNADVLNRLLELNSKWDVLAPRDTTIPMIDNGPMLVISGGEPFLQQKALYHIVHYLKRRGWWVEIETNGTVPPRIYFTDELDQINCSPKLANSGDPLERRIVPHVLTELARMDKTNFKFVVGTEYDMNEIESLCTKFDLRNIWLMPLGRTMFELSETAPMVETMAKRYGFNYSPRKHIELWGSKRGV